MIRFDRKLVLEHQANYGLSDCQLQIAIGKSAIIQTTDECFHVSYLMRDFEFESEISQKSF